jgi:hypothetical protein
VLSHQYNLQIYLLRSHLLDQLINRHYNHHHHHLRSLLHNHQLNQQVSQRLRLLDNPAVNHPCNHLHNQLVSQRSNHLHSRLHNRLCSHLYSLLDNQVLNRLHNQVDNQLHSQVDSLHISQALRHLVNHLQFRPDNLLFDPLLQNLHPDQLRDRQNIQQLLSLLFLGLPMILRIIQVRCLLTLWTITVKLEVTKVTKVTI